MKRAAKPEVEARPRRNRRSVELDEADQQIIDSLIADGRTSNRALADRVGLTEATVAARIRNLQDRRILGVSAIFDWEAAGYKWDLRVAIEVEGRPVLEVAERLAKLRFVHWVVLMFGPVDIMLHVRLADRKAAIEFLTEEIAAVRGVRRLTADVTLETLKYEVNFARLPITPTNLVFPAPVADLDDLDHNILKALVADGRQSNREIARQLGVSDGTIRTRLRRVEEAGMLRICGQTDPYLMGRIGAWAYVGIDVIGANVREVAAKLAAIPEVLVLTVTSGRHDLEVFTVASSRSVLVDVILGKIRSIEGVRATETAEVIRSVKLDYQWARLL